MREQLLQVTVEQCKAKHLSCDTQEIGVLQLTLPFPNQRTNPLLFHTHVTPPIAETQGEQKLVENLQSQHWFDANLFKT